MNLCLRFKNKLLGLLVTGFLWSNVLNAQITLSGSEYVQDFNSLGSGLPVGWSGYTVATATSLGTAQSVGIAHVNWENTGGAFKNFASAAGPNNASTANRAFGVRQTGSFGDPGAAFVLHLADTKGLRDFALSLKLMSLDATSPRTTTWTIQYGILNEGNYTFTTIGTTYTTGNSTAGTQQIDISLGNALNDLDQPVWIRIVTLASSTGSGNRPSTAIDDFKLTYSKIDASAPALSAAPGTLSGFDYNVGNGPSAALSYLLNAANLEPAEGDIQIEAPDGFELSPSSDGSFTESLTIPYEERGLTDLPVYVRLKAGLAAGSYSNQTIVHTIGDSELSTTVTVSGSVLDPDQPCGTTSVPISVARASANNTPLTITGRITAVTLANHNIYLNDGTGPNDGILVFDNTSLRPDDLAVGDLVQITGLRAEFNGMAQLSGVSCFERIEPATTAPIPTPITGDQLCAHMGQLVSIADVTISSPSDRLAGNTTYTLSDGSVMYIHNNTGIGGSVPPESPVTVTGIVTLFGGVCQLNPRFVADIPGATPPAPCGMPLSEITNQEAVLEVVNWNVEWLGHSSNGTGANQLTNVLNNISALQADVFLLQEICSYNEANPADAGTSFGAIIQALNSEYPTRNYTGECSPAYSYSYVESPDPQGQRVCVVYRSDQVTKISSKPLMQEIYDAGVPDYPTGQSSQFWSSGRLPFLLEADVTLNNETNRVHFISLHSKANTAPQDMSYWRRQYDHKVLYDYLETEYPDANIIMAGDFNDDFDQSIYQYGSNNISSWSPFLYTDPNETDVFGPRPNELWHALTYKYSGTGCSSTPGYSTFIDHVMVSDEIAYSLPNSRTSAGEGLMVGSVETIRGTSATGVGRASDHYPTFTSYTLNSSLPVSLAAFNLTEDQESRSVNLSWSTASEQNSAYFEVQKSDDAKRFAAIGRVEGAENSGKLTHYSFRDHSPSAGMSYYRLKLVDLDGSFDYSGILSARFDLALDIYPNPVVHTVRLSSEEPIRTWSVYRANGALAIEGNQPEIDFSGLNTGLYLLKIQFRSGETTVRKLIKN